MKRGIQDSNEISLFFSVMQTEFATDCEIDCVLQLQLFCSQL